MAEVKKTIVNLHLFEIHSGKTKEVKMWANSFNKSPFSEGDVLYVIKAEKKPKREPTGRIDERTGKKEYADVPNKFENWLSQYRISKTLSEVSA